MAQAEPHAKDEDMAQYSASSKRPKKRRKVETLDDEHVREAAAGDEDTVMHIPEGENTHTPPLTDSALPQFALPTRPDAPSKFTLALQGQDKALIEADLVDPRRTTQIEGVGIGEKTSRRLKELGINELFAGKLHA